MALLLNTHYRLAKDSLRRNRGRTFLSALGIAIGVASIVLILSLTGGINKLINANSDKNNANLIIVRPSSGKDFTTNLIDELSENNQFTKSSLTLNDVDTISKIEGIESVSPLAITTSTLVANDKPHDGFHVVASNYQLGDILNFKLNRGEFLKADSRENAAVIGYKAAMQIFGGPEALTKTIIYNNQRFMIIGVLEELDEPINYNGVDFDNSIIINADYAKTFESALQIQQIDVRTATTGAIDQTADTVKNALAENKGNSNSFQVVTGNKDLHPAGSLLSIVSMMLTIVAGISIVVGGVGIMNIMLVSVSERTREIGIRKAVGASSGNILLQFLLESTILSIAGGIMGFALGYVGAFLISLVTPFAVHISWQILAITGAVSLVTGILFGIYPAVKAARKDPIISLKFYR